MRAKILLAFLLLISAASAVTFTLNDTNSGNLADTFVNGSATTTNYGTLTSMQVAYVTTASRIFMLWDVPTGSTFTTVTNAQLILNASTVGGAVSHQCYNTSNAWTETGLTWDTQPSANTLQSATTLAGVGVYNWTVTDAVNACMKQANTNCSLMVKLTTESGSQANYFYTKENALVTARPQLNITYTNSYTFPETGLVGYWKFDEGIGSNTVDSSGSENSGTISGASWTTSKYRMNSTLNYDGVNQQVSGSFSPTTTTMNFTVSGWIYPTSQTGVIFGLYNASTSWVIYLNTGRDLSVYNGSVDIFSKWFYPPLYTWTHIAIVYDGSYISGYENGVLIGSTAFSTLKTPTTPTFYLGTTPTFTTDYTGTIDEVKIYNVSQSSAWVLTEYLKNGCLYNMNVSCFNESSTSQQIYYDLILTNTTASQTFSNAYNWTSNQYCNGSTPMNSVTLTVSNDSFYSPRYRYVDTATSPNVTAYLLPLSALWEIDVTILVKNELGGVIPSAEVTMMKSINGGYVDVAQDTSDGGGQTYFNLDKQTAYQLIANATGYDQYSVTFQPSQSVYTITLTSNQSYNTSLVNDSMWGISWNMTPRNYMVTGVQNFNFSIYDSYNDLEFWGMNITYNGTLQYTTNQTDSGGGFVNYTMNTSQVEGNGINVTIFFKRTNYPYFDPTYKYWGYSIVASNYSLVNAMANVGNSALSPLTKGIIAIVMITCVVGYVATSVSFSGGVVLGLLMLWGFSSFGFMPPLSLMMITIVGLALIYNRHFALTPAG
ncbi:MAG: Concanavalin A-like lectin/glucanases superfamily protein (plasmid) [Candidatus Fermentimicrarchaeum limneticum]|uniref:Concanavalin A-like lectin/glucanases superfamily protein n=1 Tax=Fermentimicrarchaeum limneticum TaxID=2795018 RepID=A0A7D5XG12_FERL1|nr:MAG: Concanavalin A-like lectin/glucanases superfamily protein [Candidatus Fermentimicrarchaeum limneticum]